MFGILRRGITADLLNGNITATDFYNRLFLTALLGALAILIVSFSADVAGQDWINIVLIPIWMAAVMYVKYHINIVLAVLSTSATVSTLRDADRQRIIDGMQSGWAKWEKIANHAALFGGVFGLTRFLVPIKAYPFMGLVLLGALLTLGMLAWIEGAGKWYTRYAYGIVFVALAIGLFGSFTGKPGIDRHPAAPIIDSTGQAAKSVIKKLPEIVSSSSSNSAGQTWDPYAERITCPIRWNAEEDGPWCYVVELPPGSYRIMPVATGMWQQAMIGADGTIGYHNIPVRGTLLGNIWNPPDRSYREFVRMAPLGGTLWFGRLIARVGEKMLYDPYEHGYFTITVPTKVYIGPNLPPLKDYVAMNIGEVSFDIERLRP
jgi:hypothetical protein